MAAELGVIDRFGRLIGRMGLIAFVPVHVKRNDGCESQKASLIRPKRNGFCVINFGKSSSIEKPRELDKRRSGNTTAHDQTGRMELKLSVHPQDIMWLGRNVTMTTTVSERMSPELESICVDDFFARTSSDIFIKQKLSLKPFRVRKKNETPYNAARSGRETVVQIESDAFRTCACSRVVRPMLHFALRIGHDDAFDVKVCFPAPGFVSIRGNCC